MSAIPHYTTLQKAAARLDVAILKRILESFVIHARIKSVFAGIDATRFGHTQSSYYYTKRIRLRRKFVKMSAISDVREQLACAIKIRHRQRHDSVDFMPLLERTNQIIPVETVVANKGHDSEINHVVSDNLGITCIIPPRYADVPVYKTRGCHRKRLKRVDMIASCITIETRLKQYFQS